MADQELTTEQAYCVAEAECIAAADTYFGARSHLMDTAAARRIFEAGFKSNTRANTPDSAAQGAMGDERQPVQFKTLLNGQRFQFLIDGPVFVRDKSFWKTTPDHSDDARSFPARMHDLVYPVAQPSGATAQPIDKNYVPGEWFDVKTIDAMSAFYMSRLPAIRDAAKELGYAIGLHGSTRRDFDLMAMPWRDDSADKDTLAHAIAMAACGITRDGAYQWEQKPLGRLATSIPICWVAKEIKQISSGHIDLSVISMGAQPSVRDQIDADRYRTLRAGMVPDISKDATRAEFDALVDSYRTDIANDPVDALLANTAQGKPTEADAKRLDFMCQRELRMVMSRDGEVCTIWGRDEENQDGPFFGYPQQWFDSARQAIDAAIALAAKKG